jgi:hypothetical protein
MSLLSPQEREARYQALVTGLKRVADQIPVVGLLFAPHDTLAAYERAKFEHHVRQLLEYLVGEVKDMRALFSNPWLRSDEGQLFARKVIDCALDSQLEDKQQLFGNVLIHGREDHELPNLEKLKFVDILRHLSRAALDVLAEIHPMYKNLVIRPGRARDGRTGSPQISVEEVIRRLSKKFHPFLIESAIAEMTSIGLFSRYSGWYQLPDGEYHTESYVERPIMYSDFTARFVEFITNQVQEASAKSESAE